METNLHIFILHCIGTSISRNKLHNKIQLLNANPSRFRTLHICVKKAEPKGFCHLFSIFVFCCFFFYSLYRTKSWARHIIYLFIYVHLKIIEKSSRDSYTRRECVKTWHCWAEICSLACFSFLCFLRTGKTQLSALRVGSESTHIVIFSYNK